MQTLSSSRFPVAKTALLSLAAWTALSCGGGGDGITVASRVASVTVLPANISLAPNASAQLTATARDASGNALSGVTATWTSNNNAAATVVNGVVTGVAPGSAQITATMEKISASATVTVAIPTFVLTITGAGTGSGSITSSPTGVNCAIVAGSASCSNSFNSGTVVTLTATPASGNTFLGWSGACTGTGSCQVTMDQARSVTATFDAPPTVLLSGAPTTISGNGGFRYYAVAVPAGSATLTIAMSGGTGSADMYVRFNALPDQGLYDCRSVLLGNADSCIISSPSTGTYYIGIYGNGAYSGVTLTATVSTACAPTTLTIETPVNGSITTGTQCVFNNNRAAVYSVTSNQIGSVQFNVNAQFFPEIAVRATASGDYITWGANALSMSEVFLLPTGTFLFSVGTRTGASGTFNATATRTITAFAPGQCGRQTLLSMTATYTGQSLATTDCFRNDGSARTNTYYDQYFIASSSSCTITMRSTAFDAFLSLRTPNGTEILSDNNGGGGTDAQITLPQCLANGEVLLIWANSATAFATGTYTLTVAVTGAGPGGTAAPGKAFTIRGSR